MPLILVLIIIFCSDCDYANADDGGGGNVFDEDDAI